MLVLNPATTIRLGKVVNGITGDPFLREDLMQEALSHFWKTERKRPGQTLSWYLQSCSFHLRHCLASGRSVDSSKRRGLQIDLPEDEDPNDPRIWQQAENSVLAQVQAREIIRLLGRCLTSREQAVLYCLDEGLGPREIGRRLKISHPTVIKCRRKIAAMAIRLGIDPCSPTQVRPGASTANGSTSPQPLRSPGAPNHANGCHGQLNGHAVNGHVNGHGHHGQLNGRRANGHVNGNGHHGQLNGHRANGHVNGDEHHGSLNGRRANGRKLTSAVYRKGVPNRPAERYP